MQLREKEASFSTIVETGKGLLSLLRPRGVPLLINDHADIAKVVGADGVHVGQRDGSVERIRHLMGPRAIIGLSVENPEQAHRAFPFDIDYLAASPVFETKTKGDCAVPWGIKGLKWLCESSPVPIVAIGGITVDNVDRVWRCGVAGIAVVSAICCASDPKRATIQLLSKRKDENISPCALHSGI